MNDGGSEWERPDAASVTPSARGARLPVGDAVATPARSLLRRRGRSPVVAAFDAGGDVFQRSARSVLVGSAALLAPLVAINLWVTVIAFDRFDPDESFFPSPGSTATGVEDVAPFVGVVGVSIAAAIVGWFVAGIALDDRFGRAPHGLGEHLADTARRLPAIVLLWVVGHWWQPVLVLMVVSTDRDDVAGLTVATAGLAWFAAAATLFAVPVARTEGLGAVAAMRRSWRLFRRASGPAIGFVAGSTALGGLVIVGLGTVAPLLEATGFLGFGDITWLVQGILVQLGVLVVMPLIAACTAQLYVEVRLDREGLDVELEADAVFGRRADRDSIADGAPT